MKHWSAPTAGEIIWCHFPDDIHPRPKPRPALIIAVFDSPTEAKDSPAFIVRVAYGTSQRTTSLKHGEFAILQRLHPAAYRDAGLSYDTKFNLGHTVDLPYSVEWFSPPPSRPHGEMPKLGILHPSLVRAVEAAYRAALKK